MQGPFASAFVTGGTGLLGNNLVRLLAARGTRVTALVRSPDKARTLLGDLVQDGRVAVVAGDLADTAFAPALAAHDVLFHTAAYFRDGYKGGSHRQALLDTNVEGTRALLEAAREAGIRRVVHTSSIAVLDGPPDVEVDETMSRREADADDYYLSKILSEREVARFLDAQPEMWAAFVLPGWMHGPGDAGPTSAGQTVLDFARRRVPGVPPGSFSVVDARDVAAAMVAVAERGRRGERYLAAGRHMTMAELFPLLERATGAPAPTRRLPLPLLWALALAGEAGARLLGRPALLSLPTVRLLRREAGRTRFSARRFEGELGLRFRPLAETLADEVAWYRGHGWLPRLPQPAPGAFPAGQRAA
jgi:dihydroflavonol-4-reductase